ncbi:hypothetical protein DMB66_31310 [Actinoplanes sp. ATCC 53533]|uniref:hypothetical protein n=1 Tax=Actinoplanes sp. ATCC 53533 TaxID=1288362 RepID=UPI000F78BF81|nr:hypothetical protein [Actinoplanes sp. ATCC 53533]RSM57992.1 hypothetical protein DMB66_31310 [Actinoplanes sp. ATCC 53533]
MFRHLFRRERLGRSRWVAAAVLTLTAVAGLSIASPAHAEAFPISDTFDDSRLWTIEEVPGASSAFVGTLGEAHTRSNAAYLDAYPLGPAEARVFRAITLNNGASVPTTCQASVWLRNVPMPENFNVQAHLRVHSGGPTGQIISVIGANINSTGWTQRNFAAIPWPGNTRTITVEIAAYHGVAMADDLTVSC